ncbi:MAG: alanine--tRNA ligase, partial [Bacilli bacterium]|nr:alanine--tRNA ligase [Bacilli bacterium]
FFWLSLGVDPSHIIKLEGNFWEIGEGPSGPDSEIFYDKGKEFDPDNIGLDLLRKDIDNDRYVEIWNNVFSQYNAKEGVPRDEYLELPTKNIDVGVGLERLTSIVQGTKTNFESDLFLPIIKEIEIISNKKYNGDKAFKVIADHIRAITFALADGATFSNEGRGYVLRRLLRRSVRYGRKLGIEEPFISKLVDTVVNIMEDPYPYLIDKAHYISDSILKEEELFHKTLDSGEKRLLSLFKNNKDKKISGKDAFKLYDTYGFPFELTLEYATEYGFDVSKEEFTKCMEQQRNRAREARSDVLSMSSQNELLMNYKEKSDFVGYDKEEVKTNIIGILKDNKFVESIDDYGYIILKETPFYAESGGQVTDTGYLIHDNFKAEVIDVQKAPNQQHIHEVKVISGVVTKDSIVNAIIDKQKRSNIRKNHSTAHLIQNVLREILGDNLFQAGSRVDEHDVRFDFTYSGKITDDLILSIEKRLNEKVNRDMPTKVEVMAITDAKKSGAIHLFGEKYGNIVRVVTIDDSIELCGGTHIHNLNEIEKVAVISLESKGANVYRIVAALNNNIESSLKAVTSSYALEMSKLLNKVNNILEMAKSENMKLDFNYQMKDLDYTSYSVIIDYRKTITELQLEIKNLEKEYNKKREVKVLNDLSIFTKDIQVLNNYKVIITKVDGYEIKILKQIMDNLMAQHNLDLIFIINVNDDNVNYLLKVNSTMENILHAGNIVKQVSTEMNGSGGGNPYFAQGGSRVTNNITLVLEDIKELVLHVK